MPAPFKGKAIAKRRALRHRLAFEARPFSSDGHGNTEGEFETVFIIHAAIEARLGGEQVLAQRLVGVQPVTIGIRQSRATKMITTDWRARHLVTGVIYNIRSIADADDDRRYFDLLCDSGVAT
jgi:SPP1 family predicted phage head-tail adaptor